MPENLVAKSTISINVSLPMVWDALINPSIIKQYMFGTEVVSEWKVGSPIVWKGIWQGKSYEDKGVIIQIVPEYILKYTHFSPLSGTEDLPQNYHTMTYQLESNGESTHVLLSQDNNPTEDDLKHSQQMWDSMLAGLKKLLEVK